MMRSLRGQRQLDWLAARSSAIGEDGAAASFAGQNLTRLAMPPTPMAVIIQTMIPADVAGVMFTRDPRTGKPDRLTEAY